MIKLWMVTGDTHADMSRFETLQFEDCKADDVGVIILGDAGCNYYSGKKDIRTKQILEQYGHHYYLVRGNHEERPENVVGMTSIFDEEINGEVWFEPAFPHIKYLKDGGIYTFGGHRTLVIGGAYSIDKWYRLYAGFKWFVEEQLSPEEMETIEQNVTGQHFDFVLSHTCPKSWEPVDLFLRGIDQSMVDKTMEIWLDKLKNEIDWKIWLFGHYHADRLERPGVEMFYTEIEPLEEIWLRWMSGKELPWWVNKSPNFESEA